MARILLYFLFESVYKISSTFGKRVGGEVYDKKRRRKALLVTSRVKSLLAVDTSILVFD